MAGAFPLAVYTAAHGLSWTYLRSAIDYAALDRCRKLLGPLPDFDAGETGYEGVAADGANVFVIRCFRAPCFRAPKWDFMGRDAIYLAVSWVARARAVSVDFKRLLRAPELNVPTHTPPLIFHCDTAWTPQPNEPIEGDRVLFRRQLVV